MTKQELNIRIDELSWVIQFLEKKNMSKEKLLNVIFARFDYLVDLKVKEQQND